MDTAAAEWCRRRQQFERKRRRRRRRRRLPTAGGQGARAGAAASVRSSGADADPISARTKNNKSRQVEQLPPRRTMVEGEQQPKTRRRRRLGAPMIFLTLATCCLIAPYCATTLVASAGLDADLTTTNANSTPVRASFIDKSQQQQQQAGSNKTSNESSVSLNPRQMKVVQKYMTNQALSDAAYNYLLTAYSFFIIVGTSFNSLICLTVLLRPRILSPRNVFIVNLAASDLLLCVFTMPFSFIELSLKMWHFGDINCKLVAGLQATSIFVSTLSITAIAMDRYKVIVYPVHRETVHHHSTHNGRANTGGCSLTRRDALLVACVWIGALLLSSPLFYFRTVIHPKMKLPGEVKVADFCVEQWPMKHGRGIYSVGVMIVQYIVPISIVSVVYAQISDKLKKRLIRRQRLTQLEWQQKRQLTLIRRTHAMLISVSLIFGLSWLPLNLLNVINDFSTWFNNHEEQFYRIVFAVCHLIGCSSACTNPILYAYLNENFRKECHQVYLHYARRLANCLRCSKSKDYLQDSSYSQKRYLKRDSKANNDAAANRHHHNNFAANHNQVREVIVADSPSGAVQGKEAHQQRPPLLSLNGPTTSSSSSASIVDDNGSANENNKCPLRPSHLQLSSESGKKQLQQDKAASDGEQAQLTGEADARRCSTMTTASSATGKAPLPPPFGATMRFCLCIRGSSSIETLEPHRAGSIEDNAAKRKKQQQQETSGWSSSCSPSTATQYDGTHSFIATPGCANAIKMDQLSAAGGAPLTASSSFGRKWRRRSSSGGGDGDGAGSAVSKQESGSTVRRCSYCECQSHNCHLPNQSERATARADLNNSGSGSANLDQRRRNPMTGKSAAPGREGEKAGAQVKVKVVKAGALDPPTSTQTATGGRRMVRQQGRRVWLRFLSGGLVNQSGGGRASQGTEQVNQPSLCGHCEINCRERSADSIKQDSTSPVSLTTSQTLASQQLPAQQQHLGQKPLLKVAPISQRQQAASCGFADLAEKSVEKTLSELQKSAATAYHYLSIEPVVMLDSRSACTLSERSTSLLVLDDDEDDDEDEDEDECGAESEADPTCDAETATEHAQRQVNVPVTCKGEESQQSMSRHTDSSCAGKDSMSTASSQHNKLPANRGVAPALGSQQQQALADDKLIARMPPSDCAELNANANSGMGGRTGSGAPAAQVDASCNLGEGGSESDNSVSSLSPSSTNSSSSTYSCLLLDSRTSTCSCTTSTASGASSSIKRMRTRPDTDCDTKHKHKQQQQADQEASVGGISKTNDDAAATNNNLAEEHQTLASIRADSHKKHTLRGAKQIGNNDDNDHEKMGPECKHCRSTVQVDVEMPPTPTSILSSPAVSTTTTSPLPTSPTSSQASSQPESSTSFEVSKSTHLEKSLQNDLNLDKLLLVKPQFKDQKSNSVMACNGLIPRDTKKNHCLPSYQRSA